MTGLNVIALISGGKDSFFSILHCLAQGHKVIALANMQPRQVTDDDIESYMYQTIGHNIIPLYAQALDLPLYRSATSGQAYIKGQTYQDPETADSDDERDDSFNHYYAKDDEIEALLSLLKDIIAKQPKANAVSTGAILSTYQRTRIESVALRLKLTPLAYLWQFPYLPPYTQTSLLQDMAAVGQDSRVIKVASGGLDERHLWLNVADAKTVDRLGKDMSRFGAGEVGAVLGEGGEFETLAIDGPDFLWKGRIHIQDEDRETKTMAGGSAIMTMRIGTVIRKPKEWLGTPTDGLRNLRRPPLWDFEFDALLKRLKSTQHTKLASSLAIVAEDVSFPLCDTPMACATSGPSTFMSNISAPGGSAMIQTEAILHQIRGMLVARQLKPRHIAFVTILLRSMSDFAAVNEVYARLFTKQNPPARITVACGNRLPVDAKVMMSFVSHDCDAELRRCLHVQSRSYWAPANIGPYSQAVAVPAQLTEAIDRGWDNRARDSDEMRTEIAYVAGQIPLIPSSMELVSQNFHEQTVLSLQHLWRIGRTMGVEWWSSAIIFITACNKEEARERAVIAADAWRKAHGERKSDAEMSDAGHDDHDIADHSLHSVWTRPGSGRGDYNTTARAPLPAWDCMPKGDTPLIPNCFTVQVEELPRGAHIEWSTLGVVTHGKVSPDWDDEYHRVGQLTFQNWTVDKGNKTFDCDTEDHGLMEVFTTAPESRCDVLTENMMVVPCKAVFDGSGIEHERIVRHRYY